MIQDPELGQVVSRILGRSERQDDPALLQRTYVETGVLPQLDNDNNQILYGRRGTGKTHVLRVLGQAAQTRADNLVVYLDLRILGSAQQVADPGRPLAKRCISLFKDFLTEIHTALLEVATDPLVDCHDDALEKVDRIASMIVRAREWTSRAISASRGAAG